MNNESIFLKYLIDEEIYLIDERNSENQSDRYSQEDDKHEITGIFKDKIILLLDYSDHVTIPETDKEFLHKVLISVHVDDKKVKYLHQEDTIGLSIEDFDNCKIIAFLNQIPDNLSALFKSERYVTNTYLNNKLVWCDPLDKTKDDNILKRKLWDQLKILFDILS
jgi:hypothetical protein